MQYRPLGSTGLNVSVLSFGASSLGGVFGPIDEAQGIRTVHTALDGGVNLIDVSPFYGLTKAERVLGKALTGIDRERYLLASKCGRYGHDFSDFDFSARRITQSLDESLQRLGVDHLDIFQAHDIEFGDLDQIVNETIPAMLHLKKAGKCRFIGITGLPLKIFTEVLGRIEPGTLDTILSYCHYSLNDTALLGILPTLKALEVGVINAAPVSMGLLTPDGVPPWHPAPAAVRDRCREAALLCERRNTSIVKLALQFAVAEPGISTTLVGSAEPEQIQSNLQWIEEPLDEQLLGEVLHRLAPTHNQTWLSGHECNNR